jgi:zeta-carotene desaturase
VGAPLHGIQAFLRTNQLKVYDKARNAVALALSPVVRALVDPDGALQQVRDLDDVSIHCFCLRFIRSVLLGHL